MQLIGQYKVCLLLFKLSATDRNLKFEQVLLILVLWPVQDGLLDEVQATATLRASNPLISGLEVSHQRVLNHSVHLVLSDLGVWVV